MHIGIDLGTQMLNSSVLLKLPKEGKDLYLNRAIRNIIKSEIEKINNNVFNIASYQDIRSYYTTLAPLIYKTTLSEHSSGYKYNAFLLPSSTTDQISSGTIENGVKYRVLTAGTTDLSDFGYKVTPVVGETFTCDIDDVVAATNIIPVNDTMTYRIKARSTADYTGVGASNNLVGTIFKSTANASLAATNNLDVLEVIYSTPTWAGGTILQRVFQYDYDYLLVALANVDNSIRISSGALVAGKKYRVVTAGTTNLYSYGHKPVPVADEVFLCSTSGTPTWDGTTTLVETEDYVCRLMKPQDTESLLSHSFGSTYDSPIAEIISHADGELVKVYNDGDFSVNQVDVVYVKKPDKVNIITSVNCNLHENMHDEVLQKAIDLIKIDDDRLTQKTQ